MKTPEKGNLSENQHTWEEYLTQNVNVQNYKGQFQKQACADRYTKRFQKGERKFIHHQEQKTVTKILNGLDKCESILDIPSGAGRFLATLTGKNNRKVIEADISSEMLAYAQEVAQELQKNVYFMVADGQKIPMTDSSIDCIFCNRLLHHIHDIADRTLFLREFYRVSCRYVIVSFFNYHKLGKIRIFFKALKGRFPDYKKRPTQKQFKKEIEDCGFIIRKIVPAGFPWQAQEYMVLEKKS